MVTERYEGSFTVEVLRVCGRVPTAELVGESGCVDASGKTCEFYAHSFYCDYLCGLLNKIFGTDHSLARAVGLKEVTC